ncbi:hypothetical protein Tco_0647749 [Tanacetum coccineum]
MERLLSIWKRYRCVHSFQEIQVRQFHLHANVVRFQRESKFNASQPTTANLKSFTSKGAVNNSFADILKSNNTSTNSPIVSSPAIVLDDTCIVERDFSSSLMGKIKDINAMSNLYRILANEGFENVKLSYLGGMSANKSEDNSSSDKEFEHDFVRNKSDNFDLDNEEEIDHVSDSSCMHDKAKLSNSNASVYPNKSKDPFEIYKILKRKNEPEVTKSDEPQFPPGFTPEVVDENDIESNSEKISHSKTILAITTK